MNRVPPPESSSVPPGSSSPPQKKPKIDEEDSSSVSSDEYIYPDELKESASLEIPIILSEYNSDEEYQAYENQKVDRAIFDKYYQQLEESEGFDITDFPGQCPMTPVYPMPYYMNDPKNADTMKDYAGQALKIYNGREGTNYEVNSVSKVNGGGCRYFHFYLTFSVKTPDGEDKIFQEKVVRDVDDSVEFPMVRPKPKKGSDLQ